MIDNKISMVPFDVASLAGIPEHLKATATQMLRGVSARGTAYFTIHGRKLKKGETLRRGGPHTDGNYEPHHMDFGKGGGNGWKVGEDGPSIDSDLHARQYNAENGGLILASNYEACLGWLGEYDETPRIGGDCSHIELGDSFTLQRNSVYYGNNHFIHESLPMSENVHRVFARITLPEHHTYPSHH